MTCGDWLIIVAIILGPILAVQIQGYLEDRKVKRERQMNIFRTLMTTRATPLSPLHVQTLNIIDVEFHKNKKIVEAWKLLLDNFMHYPTDYDDPNYGTRLEDSNEKSKELLIDLLYKMAKVLNYDFDKVHLKRGVYIPKGHAEMEMDQFIIRKNLLDLFSGKKPMPIKIVNASEKKQTEKPNIKDNAK